MAKLLFYRQKRVDGGIRTGLEWNDSSLSERFDDGPGERDPILLWYIDVKCEGPGIPDDPDLAEQWFVDRGEILREYMTEYAQKLRTGVDVGIQSLAWNIQPKTGENVEIRITCSASDRMAAREISSILNDLAARWDLILDSLVLVEPAKN